MIINMGTNQKRMIDYIKARNGEWVRSRDIMHGIYGGKYNVWCGNNLCHDIQTAIRNGFIERRVAQKLNRFGRVAVEWYEYRYTNYDNNSIRTDTIEWIDGKPNDWVRTIYIDDEIIYQGKDW